MDCHVLHGAGDWRSHPPLTNYGHKGHLTAHLVTAAEIRHSTLIPGPIPNSP